MIRDVFHRAVEGLMTVEEVANAKSADAKLLEKASQAIRYVSGELIQLGKPDGQCRMTQCGQELLSLASILDVAVACCLQEATERETRLHGVLPGIKGQVFSAVHRRLGDCWTATRKWWMEHRNIRVGEAVGGIEGVS